MKQLGFTSSEEEITSIIRVLCDSININPDLKGIQISNESTTDNAEIELVEKVSHHRIESQLVKLGVDEGSIRNLVMKVNKSKINNFCRKVIEQQDKLTSFRLNENDRDFIRETKNYLEKLKEFLITDLCSREALIKEIISTVKECPEDSSANLN